MKIFDIITEDKKTWMKDGVEMCSKDCCGQPVTECECGPECKHCDCYKVNERYSLAQGRPAMGKFTNDQTIDHCARRIFDADDRHVCPKSSKIQLSGDLQRCGRTANCKRTS